MEEYRIYHYSNGHKLQVNSPLGFREDGPTHVILLHNNEILEVERGWIAITKKFPIATDGDQTR